MVAEEKVLRTQSMIEFATTGDVTGLAALADCLQENGGNYHWLRRLRVFLAMTEHGREDVRFFVASQGIDHREVFDSLKAAMSLRRIEKWKDECCEVEWLVDTEYDPNEYDSEGMPDIRYGCVVRWYENGISHAPPKRTLTQSLWSITFGNDFDPTTGAHQWHQNSDDDYRRLAETELAEELFGEVMCLDH